MSPSASPESRLVAVGLGPGGEGLINLATLAALEAAELVVLRTAVHPGVAGLLARPELRGKPVYSCDPLYESMSGFEAVYDSIAERLASLAGRGGLSAAEALAGLRLLAGAQALPPSPARVAFATPGSPLVAERSVELLRARMGQELETVPGLSFLDLAAARAGFDPFASSLTLVDAEELLARPGRYEGDLLIAQVWSAELAAELVGLLSPGSGARRVLILSHLGLDEERVAEVGERSVNEESFDHLTSLYVQGFSASAAHSFAELAEVVAKLRIECPWDRKQTHKSLGKHLIEESYEVLDAIDALDAVMGGDGEEGAYAGEAQYLADELAAELGDLVVQVFFHAVIAAEEGYFDLAFVMESIRAKLIRRHPHVFAGLEVSGVEEVLSNWEEIKRAEKEISEPAESVPSSMPALLYAAKVIRKAQAFGYRAPERDAAAARLAGLASSPEPEGLGELAFALAELAKLLGVDLEAELRQATRDFSARFREV